jgi:hypothetical protein
MTKYGFLAALPALALATPAFAQLQPVDLVGPVAVEPAPVVASSAPPLTIHTDPLTGDRVATMVLPPAVPPAIVTTPTTIAPDSKLAWVSGHYDWSNAYQNYEWTAGHFVERPSISATWVAGHWEQRPNHWLWIDGRWD